MLDLVVLSPSDEARKRIRPFDVSRQLVTEMIFPRSMPVFLFVYVSVPVCMSMCAWNYCKAAVKQHEIFFIEEIEIMPELVYICVDVFVLVEDLQLLGRVFETHSVKICAIGVT